MDIYEDSMPFRFTPDGLDESTIDDLIEQAFAQVSDQSAGASRELVERRPAHDMTDLTLPNGEAA